MSEEPIKPGIYDGVSQAVYQSWPAVNHSKLKEFRKTPAHALYALKHPKPPTKALDIGEAGHAAILEPARFEAEFAGGPKVNRTYKEGKQAWKAFEEANPGKIHMAADDYAMCLAMRDSVWLEGSVARSLLESPGRNERSFVWQHQGQLCKGRCDRMCRWLNDNFVVDVKTADSAEADDFAKAILKYSYHTAAAYYLDGLYAIGPAPRRFAWLVLEKEPPYLFALYAPTDRLLDQGRATYERWLTQYRTAIETNVWPGYSASIQTIDVPTWGQTREILEVIHGAA